MNLIKRGKYWHIRFQINGKEVWRSTKKTNEKEANELAKALVCAQKMPWWKEIQDRLQAPIDPLISEVIKEYRLHATSWIKDRTARDNTTSLKRICDAMGAIRPSELNNIQKYADAKLARDDDDEYRRASIVRSILSEVRQAKSCFSKEAMQSYKFKFKAPSFTVSLPRRTGLGIGFVPFTLDEELQLAVKMEAIKDKEANVYRMYLLMVKCGLRNSECKAARGSWLKDGWITIKREDDFTPKTVKSQRALPMSKDLWKYFSADLGDSALRLIKEFKSTQDKLNDIMREVFPNRQKGAYELRKQAGSIVYTNQGVEASAKFLGDSTGTAEKYYAALLKPLKAI